MKARLRIRRNQKIVEETVEIKTDSPTRLLRNAEEFVRSRNENIPPAERDVLLAVAPIYEAPKKRRRVTG